MTSVVLPADKVQLKLCTLIIRTKAVLPSCLFLTNFLLLNRTLDNLNCFKNVSFERSSYRGSTVYIPGVYGPGLGQRNGKLRPTLHLDNPSTHQRLHPHGYLAAVTSASPQLPVITVSPRPHAVVISDAQSLRVTTPAGYVDHTVSPQGLHHLGGQQVLAVTMTQPSIAALAPRV